EDIVLGTVPVIEPAALADEMGERPAIEAQVEPVQFGHRTGPRLAGKRWQAPVDKRPVEGRVVRGDEISRREDVERHRVVDGLAHEISVREAGQLSNPGIQLDAWVSAPSPRLPDLNDAARIIEPEALDGEFDDLVRLAVETRRLDVDRHANTASASGRGLGET